MPGINKRNHKVTLKDFGGPSCAIRLPCRILRDHVLYPAPLHSGPFIDFTNLSLDNTKITRSANFLQSNASKNENDAKDNEILEVLENELNNCNVAFECSEDEVENDDQDINEKSNADAINFIPSEEHPDENSLDSLEINTLKEEDVELLKKIIDGNFNESMSDLFLYSKLDPPPSEIRDVFSSVLGD